MMRTLVATLSLSLLPALSLADGPVSRPSTRHALRVYTAFGGTYPFGSISDAFQRYTFTGRESSGHSAAGAPMFYRNRQYSPGLGRFGRRDPVLGGDPQFNSFSFPGDDPVDTGDALGLGTDEAKSHDLNEHTFIGLAFIDISKDGKAKFAVRFPKPTCSMTAILNRMSSTQAWKPQGGGMWKGGYGFVVQDDFKLDLNELKKYIAAGSKSRIPMSMILQTSAGERYNDFEFEVTPMKYVEQNNELKFVLEIANLADPEERLQAPRRLRVPGEQRRINGLRIRATPAEPPTPPVVGLLKAASFALSGLTVAQFEAKADYYKVVPKRRSGALFGPVISIGSQVTKEASGFGLWQDDLALSLRWTYPSQSFPPMEAAPIVGTNSIDDDFLGFKYDKKASPRLGPNDVFASAPRGTRDYSYDNMSATVEWRLEYKDKWFVVGVPAGIRMSASFLGPGAGGGTFRKTAGVELALPGK